MTTNQTMRKQPFTLAVRQALQDTNNSQIEDDLLFLEAWEMHPSSHLGVTLRDPETGLVDFASVRDGDGFREGLNLSYDFPCNLTPPPPSARAPQPYSCCARFRLLPLK